MAEQLVVCFQDSLLVGTFSYSWIMYVLEESGHFDIVNGEVTTVVDLVVHKTARKNSTNGVQMKKPVILP